MSVSEPVSYGTLNLRLRTGETYQRTLLWKDGSGNPINLTGYSAHMQVRTMNQLAIDLVSTGSPSATAFASGTLTLGGTAGTIVIRIAASQTALVPANSYSYDLRYIDGNGDEGYLLVGSVIVVEGITL